MFEYGEILLIPIPFTDLSSHKRRPVVVISNDKYNGESENIIVVAMTSNPTLNAHTFTVNPSELESGTLNRPGQIRADKIYTLAQSIVVKKFGKLKPVVSAKIRTLVIGLITRT